MCLDVGKDNLVRSGDGTEVPCGPENAIFGESPRKVQRPRTGQHGQALVEYALVLVLVALAAILVLWLVGQGITRVTGVIGGALGAKHNAGGAHVIEITLAECIAKPAKDGNPAATGLWVVGLTNESLDNLTGSYGTAVGTGIGGARSPVDPNGPDGFKFHPLLLENAADLSVCPSSVVIQSSDGAIAISPVARVLEE